MAYFKLCWYATLVNIITPNGWLLYYYHVVVVETFLLHRVPVQL